uniref:WGS project CAEQ00000000 data, annotated contig n=1 Tax=Globodera pallida TaxID=36090 RepID=A0A183BIT2_GLOPA
METEEKVTAGFGWTSVCSGGGPGHELCEAITLGSLDPVLSLTKLGPAVTKTPLQALLSTFLLRSGVASSLTAAQTLVGVIVGAEAKLEFCMYFGQKRDQISTGKYPTEEDQQRTLEQWVGACYTARQALAATGYRPLRMEIPEGVEALTGSERKKWKEVFEQSSWALERVRSVVVHKAGRFLAHTRVLLGDSSARLMSQYITNSYCIGEEGSMADIIRQFQPTVLSSRVQALLILAGRDSLIAGETADYIAAQFEMVVELCRRFPHVRIYWCPPPYVHAKATEHEALVAKMQDAVLKGPILPVYTTEKGRSVLEIFRFGDNFNKFLISDEGVMRNSGCKMLRAWIYTQTTFPGDNDLQVRTLQSAVTIPVGNRVDSQPTASSSRQAQRDRADPRSVDSRPDRNFHPPGTSVRYRPYEARPRCPSHRNVADRRRGRDDFRPFGR